MDATETLRAYGEATIGLAFIDETDVILVAPAANLGGNATDFYDKTTAFAFGSMSVSSSRLRSSLGYSDSWAFGT